MCKEVKQGETNVKWWDDIQNFIENANWCLEAQKRSGWEKEKKHSFNSGQKITDDDDYSRKQELFNLSEVLSSLIW